MEKQQAGHTAKPQETDAGSTACTEEQQAKPQETDA
jgi:hypothetical protein